jgi:hypothetical protein
MLAISLKDTQNKHWSEPTNLLPFKHQALIPILANEAGRLGASMPLAIHNKQLVGVCGIQADHNLYIDPKGQWSGNVVPEWLQTSPVYLQMINSTKAVPCIATPTSCLIDPPAQKRGQIYLIYPQRTTKEHPLYGSLFSRLHHLSHPTSFHINPHYPTSAKNAAPFPKRQKDTHFRPNQPFKVQITYDYAKIISRILIRHPMVPRRLALCSSSLFMRR